MGADEAAGNTVESLLREKYEPIAIVGMGLRAQALADPAALVPRYIEESMRLWSLSQDAVLRVALEDMELGG
ncbi:hypothetical protein ACH4L7_21230 [Streptomyces anulatus]